MKKLSKKQKLIGFIAILIVAVIVSIFLTTNMIKNNIANNSYNTANNNSSSANLLPEYIKDGITLGGVTGTLVDLDTSDATATEWDIMYGETAYVDGEKITGLFVPRDSLEIGDYVEYTPDTVSAYSLTSSISGYSSNQTIAQDTSLKWQIMSINDDGTVNLISDKPTNQEISLYGALGYNNGVYVLDEISSKLYSNSELGVEARNIKVEDYEEKMNSAGKNAIINFDDSGVKYGNSQYTGEFWSGSLNRVTYPYYPVLYAQEIGSGINSTSARKDGAERSEKYYSTPTTQSAQVTSSGLTATQNTYQFSNSELKSYFDDDKFYDLVFNVDTFVFSSRYTWCQQQNNTYSYNQVSWGLVAYSLNAGIWNFWLYNTDPGNNTIPKPIRPVVTIDSRITIYGGDGSEEHPYQLSA